MRLRKYVVPSAFETKVLAAFAAAVLIVAVLAATTWKVSQNAIETMLRVARTQDVLDRLAQVTAQSHLIELSTQSYRISGDVARLVERDAAVSAREIALRKIKELTADDARQQQRWMRLREVVDERLELSRRTELLRKTEGVEAANAYIASAPLRETRERLLQVLREMEADERRTLQARSVEQSRERDTAIATGAITALMLVALLAATYFLIRRQMRASEAGRRAIEAANARVGAIFDTVVDGVLTIHERGIVKSVNPAAERLFGYAAAEIIGQNVKMLMPEPYHSGHDGYLEHYRATGEARIIGKGREVVGRRKDGSTFPMELAVGEMRLGGERHFAGIVRDITARKQAEQTLIAARRAAELANRAKDSFLATMSHEIRTPLGGLLGMLEVLSLSPLNPEQCETLQAARDSGRSLLRILNDILDWSKIEDGKLELARQAVSIAGLLAGVVNTYARVASTNSVILARQVDLRLSPVVIVDPLRLSQVLNNFVSNAIKFSHRGERIELRAELVERHDGAERVRFSVRDTGIGIDPDVQQRLFQMYEQGSADTARMYGGTGLGLAICRRLADMMDGQIEVDSAPGRGSTFSITLTLPVSEAEAPGTRDLFAHTDSFAQPTFETAPAMPAQSAGEAAAAAPVPPLVHGVAHADAPLVLVVDDHPTNRRLLQLQLRLLGLRAETAEDGQAALPLWRNGRYAAVITDCHMPEMDGYALTRAIRGIEAAEARQRTPIIAWTANALHSEIETCSAAGMDALLVKPADLGQLRQVLGKWLPIATIPKQDLGTPGAPRTAAPPAVDVRVLKALVGDDPTVVRELLHDFRAGSASIAAALRAACQAGQATAAGAAAHKLKSAARSVGALALGDRCAEMERLCEAGDKEILVAPLSRFEQELLAVNACLDSLLQQH